MYKDADKQKQYLSDYNKKRAGKRSRNINFIAYPEDLPENWIEIINSTNIRWVEGPLHDKDQFTAEDEEKNPEHKEGEYKKVHKHCLMMFENPTSVEQAQRFFGELFGTNESGSVTGILRPEICHDRSGSIRYMAHLDNPLKAQYDFADIVGHNGADVNELVKFSISETLHKMVEIEQYIETHDIRELCDLASAIRDTHVDWYQIISTKNTVYFNAFIRSYRHKMQTLERKVQGKIDVETGEITDVSD